MHGLVRETWTSFWNHGLPQPKGAVHFNDKTTNDPFLTLPHVRQLAKEKDKAGGPCFGDGDETCTLGINGNG
jgi:hypothetical protein